MANSPRAGAMAFPSEVARFLLVDPAEVRRMIVQDRLPAIQIPLARRKVYRIYLPDLHRWLINRSPDAADLRNYEAFRKHFDSLGRGDTEAVGKEEG